LYYSVALQDWLFAPLEIFQPIPEPIIQKLVNFGMNFLQKDNPVAPYEDLPKYDNQILGNMVHALSSTKSDTPTVQRFYKQLLPLWKDNRETYYDHHSTININSLGFAIGVLGENGKDFLPFIENKITEEKQALDKLEKSLTPKAREWTTTKDLLKRAYKKAEKLYYIKDSILSGFGKSKNYKWTSRRGNWFKKAEERLDCIGRPIPNWGGKTVYHATDQEGFEDMQANGYRFWDMEEQSGYYGNAVHFAIDVGYAKNFGGIVTVAEISPSTKILNLNDPNDWDIFQKATKNSSPLDFRDIVIELGYDGIYDVGAGDLALYNPEKAIFKGVLQ
jgi:hypothetical protein